MISFDVIAEIPSRAVERVGQSGHHRVERNAALGVALRVEEDLDMA